MEKIFDILHLPENAPKEDVKSAFLAWKKEQQKILSHGKPEEQKVATENITKVTYLYKQFMSDSAQSDSSDGVVHKKTTPKTTNVQVVNTDASKVSSQEKTPTPKKQDKETPKIPNPEPSPSPVTNVTAEHTSSKYMVTVLIVLVVALSGLIVYLLNDKKDVVMDSAGDFVKTPLKLNEDSSIHSGRIISLEESPQDNKTTNNSKTTENAKPVEIKQEINKPLEEPKKEPDKNIGKTPTQRAAVQTLLDFHDNITKKNFGKAYDCLSWAFQNYMSYDGWVPGFATTVSSEVSDINIVSETNNVIVLTYILKAVDSINGRQTVAYFNGTVTIINENGSWKIDEIKNKVR